MLAVVSLSVPVALGLYVVLARREALMMLPMGLTIGLVDWTVIGFCIAIWLTATVGLVMLSAGTIRIISDSYLGRSTTLGQAIGLGASKIGPLVLVGVIKSALLGGLALVVGFGSFYAFGMFGVALNLVILMFALGALLCAWIAAALGMTTPAIVLEELGSPLRAFGRSWVLTRGSRARLLGVMVVAVLLFDVLPGALLGVVGGALEAAAPQVAAVLALLSGVVPVILYPAIACVLTLLYYDLRVRREAFDLQVLSQRLGS
jgi:hypothetical protein